MGVRLDYWFSINVSILIILTLTLTETSCDSNKRQTPFKCYQEPVRNETSKNCSGCLGPRAEIVERNESVGVTVCYNNKCLPVLHNFLLVVNKWTNTVESVTATECKPGYYGRNCSQSCMYPYFGVGCQQNCSCRKEQCDLSVGCSTMGNKTVKMDSKTSDVDIKTAEMDTKTFEMDSKTAEMDNKTVEMDNKNGEISKPKETLFQDILGTLFNTNSMAIMVVFVVGLILITLMIVFAYKQIRKKCSQRCILNCHNKEKLPDDSMQEPVHYEEILNITVLSTVEVHESVHQSDNG